MLSTQEWILVALILGIVIIMIFDLLRADLVAILVLAILPLTGIITVQEAFSGFSRSVVITIIGLFILTQALEDTGVVQWIADWLKRIGAGSEARLITLFMAAGAGLSLIMNNIAAGAVLLPAATQVGRESKVAPSKLLIPLAFGTLVGGMATYFTTANILMSSILRDQQQPGLSMGDFLPTGGLIALTALLFMVLAGRFLLPTRTSVGQSASAYMLSRSLYETYQLREQLWEIYIPPGAQLAGVPLGHSKIGQELGLTVLSIWRGHQAILNPGTAAMIKANDYLLVLGTEERVRELEQWGGQIGRPNDKANQRQDYYVDLTEVVIPPRSTIVGASLAALGFRNKYHLTAVALWRAGESFYTDVGKLPLEVGDALLMVGTPAHIRALAEERDFLVLQSGHAARPPLPQKAAWAIGITAAVLVTSIIEWMPPAEAMMLGVAALALTGCINLDEAYRSIGWRVIFLIAGLLPISIAMTNTGLADHISRALVEVISPYGALGLITGMFLLTLAMTQVIGGQVAALIVGPIAITAALQLGVDAQAMAVAVAIACSAAFLTPIAHPVNVLMMGPGNYTPRDFLGIGLAMTAITLAMLLVGLRWFWGV